MSLIKRNIEKIPFFIKEVDLLRLPNDTKYAFIFFPEGKGKDIFNLYPSLRFHRRYLRHSFKPDFKFRGIRYYKKYDYKSNFRKEYRNICYVREKNFLKFLENEEKENFIMDLSEILDAIDYYFGGNWKNKKAREYLKEWYYRYIEMIPEGYKKVLIYHIGNTDTFNSYYKKRRLYTLYNFIYDGLENIGVDDILLHEFYKEEERYRYKSIMHNKEIKNYAMFYQYYKRLEPFYIDPVEQSKNIIDKHQDELEIDIDYDLYNSLIYQLNSFLADPYTKRESISDINDDLDIFNMNVDLMNKALKNLSDIKIDLISDKDKLEFNHESKYDKTKKDLLNKNATENEITKTMINSLNKSKNIIDNINVNKYKRDVETINKYQNSIAKKMELSGLNKKPTRINLDSFKEESFNETITNYTSDIINKHKYDDVKIELGNMKIKETKLKENEFHITAKKTLTIEMSVKLHNGEKQKISFEIPKLENGYFILNGARKTMVSQLLIPPIYFNKPHNCIIQTLFGLMQLDYSIKNKRHTIRCNYAGKSIPLPRVLIFYLGFEKAMDLMFGKNNWDVLDEKTKDHVNYIELSNGFIVINKNEIPMNREILLESFSPKFWKHMDVNNIRGGDVADYIGLLLNDSRIVNLTQIILQKIIDPVNKKVLENMGYPSIIENLLIYLIDPLYNGKAQRRNDLNIMRIRSSEILYQIINKVIENAYTTYRMKVLTDKDNPKLEVGNSDVLKTFLTNSLVTSSEYNNLIEDVSNKFKVSYTGVETGGLKKEAVMLDTRDIDDSFYGIIDPLETSIGSNIGILQHLTPNAGIKDSRGTIDVNRVNDSNKDILGTTTSLIPLLNYNESTRLMMAANQLKQSVQLLKAEEPIVRTGFEDNIKEFSSDAYVKRSPVDGTVTKFMENKSITIEDTNGNKHDVPVYPLTLHSGQGLSGYQEFLILVSKGDKVKNNQIIAQSKYSFGQTSIKYGRNALVAFMNWEGYTFEDGLVISDKLVKDDTFTSPHTFELEVLITPDECKYISDIDMKIGEKYGKRDILMKFIPKNLSSISKFITSSDIDNGRVLVRAADGILYDIEGHLIDVDNPSEELSKFARKHKFEVSKGVKRYYKRDRIFGLLLILRFKTELPIMIGDKLSNRHGNKGVICKIEKEENMPITEWGERVEVILAPLGISGRNNFGQLMECYLGLVAKDLMLKIKEGMSKTKFKTLISKVYDIIDKTKKKETKKIIMNFVDNLNVDEYKDLPNKMKAFPILIRPFDGPDPYEINKLLSVLKLKRGYRLYVPNLGETTNMDVPVGYVYESKLEHMSMKKVKGRSTSRMSAIGQPAKTSETGAQRLGELDSFSLLSHGAKSLLDEMWTINSDNVKAKNYVVNSIIKRGEVSIEDLDLNTNDVEVRKLMKALFLSIGLEI